MEPNTSNKLLIIGAIVLLIICVGAIYLGSKKLKQQKQQQQQKTIDKRDGQNGAGNTSASIYGDTRLRFRPDSKRSHIRQEGDV